MTPAVYDLSRRPITFDFLVFVACVASRADPVHIVILADKDRAITPKDMALSPEEKRARVHRILEPSCHLHPHVGNVSIVTDEYEASCWRRTPSLQASTFIAELSNHRRHDLKVQALRSPIASPHPGAVVMTLRNTKAVPEKNCRMDVWLSAAKMLMDEGHDVVVVPDTDMADGPLPDGFNWCREAARDVPTRAALYEHAACSLSMGLGPMTIAMLMPETAYTVFVAHRNIGREQVPMFERIWGIRWGEQLPFTTPRQALDYRPDDADAIIDACRKNLAQR